MIADVNSATISYEDSKELAVHSDAAVRVTLARRRDVRPEILYFLAEDADADVRRAVAENVAAPDLSHVLLAGDNDHGVRRELATKIAAKAPGLAADEPDRARTLLRAAHAVITCDGAASAAERAEFERLAALLGQSADSLALG